MNKLYTENTNADFVEFCRSLVLDQFAIFDEIENAQELNAELIAELNQPFEG